MRLNGEARPIGLAILRILAGVRIARQALSPPPQRPAPSSGARRHRVPGGDTF